MAQEKLVNQPLDQLYRHAPGVKNFSVTKQNGKTTVILDLAPVTDLQSTYLFLERRTAAFLAPGTFQLQLKDHRDATLGTDFNQMNLAIQQGIQTGQFVDMEQNLQAEGKSFGLSRVAVQVDDYNVYLQLVRGGHYLDAVVPRYPSKTQEALLGGGS